MSSNPYTAQKKELRYSKKKIKKVGAEIRNGIISEESIDVVHNFREYHLYPLMLLKNHLAREAKKVSKNIVIARRLKRLPTIVDKLSRNTLDGVNENRICLSRMSDIAGCRAIVPNKKSLFALRKLLFDSGCVHEIKREKNYLSTKDSGYGGVHLIYSCYEKSQKDSPWKLAKVEVQLRTRLQHSWATALEIIDTFENSNLKTSYEGQKGYRRFFKLLGLLIAEKEGFVELSNLELNNIRIECLELNNELGIINSLTKYSFAIKAATNSQTAAQFRKKQGYFLVAFKKVTRGDEVKLAAELIFFTLNEIEDAIAKYNETEKDESIAMSALVSVEDSKSLKKAYPNYFGTGVQMQNFIKEAMKEWYIYTQKEVELMERLAKIGEERIELNRRLNKKIESSPDFRKSLEFFGLEHDINKLDEEESKLNHELESLRA